MKVIKFLVTIVLFVSITVFLSNISFAQTDGKTEISTGAAGKKYTKPNTLYQEPGIVFDFVDVDITTIIKFISEITGYNFIFDERVKGKITIIAPTKLSIDESFRLFTSILTLKGYTIIPSGEKTYKVIPSSLAKQAGVISVDDIKPVNEGYITKVLSTKHIKAEETLQFLRPIVSKDGHISAFGPSNLLLVVDSAVNIEKIISILKLVDQPTAMAEEAKIFVYFLEHADAVELSKVLQGIIRNLQTARKSITRNGKKTTAKSPPVLNVTADKATNSLVIVAPQSEFGNIEEVIKTLDKKRKQVYVEAMIMEASTDKLQELGTKWRAAATYEGEPVAIGGVGNIDSATTLSIINGLSGFTAGSLGNFLDVPVTSISSDGSVSTDTLTTPGFAALFSMNEFRDVINVLSTPQILTSDNEEAEIFVGENVPFISQRERNATTSNTVLNTIERTDAGIKLRIKPQITEGNYVKLEIFQEISAVKTASDDILTSVGPSTTKRSTKTSVVVKDGRTVVIGGLMQETEEESVNKVPLLGDIPLLGWLFKFKSKSKNKKNLLVFLSPHIVKEEDDLKKISEYKRDRFVKQEKFYYPGELIVKFNNGVPEERALDIIKSENASVIEYLESSGVYRIILKSKKQVEETVEKLVAYPEVMYAEPNYKISLNNDLSDRGYKEQDKHPEIPGESSVDKMQQETSFQERERDKEKPSPDNIHTDKIISAVQVNPTRDDTPEINIKESSAEDQDDTAFNPVSRRDTASYDSAKKIEIPESITEDENDTAFNPVSRRDTASSDSAKKIEIPESITEDEDDTAFNPVSRQDTASSDSAKKIEIPESIIEDEDETVFNPVMPQETVGSESAMGKNVEVMRDEPEVQEDKLAMVNDDNTMFHKGEISRDGRFFIQVGAWKELKHARETILKLKDRFPDTYIIKENNFNKVRIAGIKTKHEGYLMMMELEDDFNLLPYLGNNH
ncbi:MAG: hypothetical protein JSW20_08755 [Nitrospiraceae bacterium]|nr:MAG: hypothetical protein JSW20_08755 [Nitrospiraceae bacterium]